MAPTSRSNQPPGPGGTPPGSGGTSDRGPGGASVEYTDRPGAPRSAAEKPTAGRVPPPPGQTGGGGGGQQHQQQPRPGGGGGGGGGGGVSAQPVLEARQEGQQPREPQQRNVQFFLTNPLVYNLNKRRRKRKKYSRGLQTVQRTEDGFTLAGRRFGDAVEEGFRSYRKGRNRSARKRRDGALRDIFTNTSRGVSRFFEVGSNVPYDFTRKVDSRRFGRQIRNTVQFFTIPFLN